MIEVKEVKGVIEVNDDTLLPAKHLMANGFFCKKMEKMLVVLHLFTNLAIRM